MLLNDSKLLLDVVKNMRSLAGSLEAVANAICHIDTPSEEPAPDCLEAENSVPLSTPISLEQVRAVLTELSRAGRTAEVRGLLVKHGAEKLSEIDPQKYPVLLADAQELNNAAK